MQRLFLLLLLLLGLPLRGLGPLLLLLLLTLLLPVVRSAAALLLPVCWLLLPGTSACAVWLVLCLQAVMEAHTSALAVSASAASSTPF
jgi:hypothetical protein